MSYNQVYNFLRQGLKEYPAVKLLLALLTGMLTGLVSGLPHINLFYVIIPALVISILLICLKMKSIGFYVVVIASGIILSSEVISTNIHSPEKIIQEMPAVIKGEIQKVIKTAPDYSKILINGSVDCQELPRLENVNCILTVTKTYKLKFKLESGSIISARCNVHLPRKKLLETDFPEDRYFSSIDVQFAARASAQDVGLIAPGGGFPLYRDYIINEIKYITSQLYNEKTAAIVNALITGDQSGISRDIRESFSISGTAHVLSLSGLHIGIIALLLFTLLGSVKQQWVKFTLFCLLIILFIALTGMQPSAMRAGAMAAAFLLARTLQRRSNLLNVACFVITILIVYSPQLILSAGFQMSCASIIGIALFYQPFREFFRRIWRRENLVTDWIASSFALTFAASAAVSPIVAYYFEIVSLISPLANLLVIPLLSLALILGMFSVAFYFVNFSIASFYAASTTGLTDLSIYLNDLASSFTFSHFRGEETFLLSIAISGSIIYILSSRNRRVALFRSSVSITMMMILFFFVKQPVENRIRIVPKEKVVTIVFPEYLDKHIVLVADRENNHYPISEYDIEKFIMQLPDTVVVGVSGNCGMAMLDKIRKKRFLKIYEMDVPFQKKLQEILKLNVEIPKIYDERSIYVK